MARYVVRLMFEWGGGCLWCGNDAARDAFDAGPIEERLPLSDGLRAHLLELSAWHDGALNWAYPPDPGPWTPRDNTAFDNAAHDALGRIRAELGGEFEVVYVRLG
jgi:hypothetical protein